MTFNKDENKTTIARLDNLTGIFYYYIQSLAVQWIIQSRACLPTTMFTNNRSSLNET